MTNNYYQKHKKDPEKKHAKNIKIFLKKKKTKGKKGSRNISKFYRRRKRKIALVSS